MQDPISDMLTRIRNAQMAKHTSVEMYFSNTKLKIAEVLKLEGFISDVQIETRGQFKTIIIQLKYYHGQPVIDTIKRVSKPGLRVYKAHKDISSIPGFGIAILSTSKGVMSHKAALKAGIGGEVLCEVA